MKNLLVLLASFFVLNLTTFAQDNPPPARERLESLKVGFLTQRLNLTTEEAKAFWPVYNKYQDELEQMRKSRRENLMNAKLNFDEMSDADVEKTIDNELMFRQNELDVQKKYNPQFKKVLPIKKVAKLYKAEEDFKRKLIDMIQDKREERRQDRRQLRGGQN
ncbi:MAG TPA: hypothetical protein PKL85_13620 [Bacteroidia bacterium]|nr:hypothetical protein [Bacteroidia bacterium]